MLYFICKQVLAWQHCKLRTFRSKGALQTIHRIKTKLRLHVLRFCSTHLELASERVASNQILVFVGRFLELPQLGKQGISDEEHQEIPWSSDRLFEKNQKVFEWPLNSLGNPSTDHRADKMVQIWTDFQCWSFSSVTTNKHCRCFITLIYHNGNIMLKQTISISFCLDWGSCFCSTLLYYQAIIKSLKQPYFI